MTKQLPIFAGLDFADNLLPIRCRKCSEILFPAHYFNLYMHFATNNKFGQDFFVLRPEVLPSSITADFCMEWLEEGRHFQQMYLQNVSCLCGEIVGLKFETVSVGMEELLGRIALNEGKIIIGSPNNVFNERMIKMVRKMCEEEDQELKEVKECKESKQLKESRELKESKQTKELKEAKKAKESYEEHSRVIMEEISKPIRAQSEIVKQMLQMMQFFSNAMSVLEKRVSENEKLTELLLRKLKRQLDLERQY